jgi:ASC-1-like (ASCH) protein
MKIEKKTWPEYFQDILDGKKNFELRLADFKCQPGDTLILREWDPKTKKYSGRKIEKKVSYVLETEGIKFWSEEKINQYGFQVNQSGKIGKFDRLKVIV